MNNIEIPDSDGKDDFTEHGVEIDTSIIEKSDYDKELIAEYNKIFESDTTFWERLGNFIKAENKAGRKAKIVKDFVLTFVPLGKQVSTGTELLTEIIKDDQKDMSNFTDKLKKVRNWISWNDKDGNFSWQELGKSLLKIALAGGIVYGLNYFGLWEAVSQILG